LVFSSTESSAFIWDRTYNYEEMLHEDPENPREFFALIEFEHSVMIHDEMLLIGSKLDTEQTNICRLAFHGKISLTNSSSDKNYPQTFLPNLKVFKLKSREGAIQRAVNDREVIASNLFKKETDRSKFIGMKCQLSTGESGTIAGSFGQSSKVRIQFTTSLQPSTLELLKKPKNDVKVILTFKKFIFDKNHKMIQ
jgi:selenocysteine-specific elongation factor